MKDKIEKLRRKEKLIRAKVKLEGQRINLVNRKRQLEKIQSKGFNIRPPSVGAFIQRGSDVTNSLFGLKRKSRRRQ